MMGLGQIRFDLEQMLPREIGINVGWQATNVQCALLTICVDGIGVGGNGIQSENRPSPQSLIAVCCTNASGTFRDRYIESRIGASYAQHTIQPYRCSVPAANRVVTQTGLYLLEKIALTRVQPIVRATVPPH